jgi:chromosome segregation ATPase
MGVRLMPEELKKAADEFVRLTREVESLQHSIEEEERGLVEEEVLPKAATAKRDKLRVTLHRAEAELARVKSEYDRLLAEWRHGG